MPEILIYGDKDNVLPNEITSDDSFLNITRSMIEFKKKAMTREFALIIIDLEGHEDTGMKLAAYIRETPRHCLTPILFMAKTRDHESTALHKIHCYDYLLKPISYEEVLGIMMLCLKRLSSDDKNEPIIFTVAGNIISVAPDDILYLEYCDRSTIIHTLTGEITVPSLRLSDFVASYGERFIQIHRSIVVNKRHVAGIDFSKRLLRLTTSLGSPNDNGGNSDTNPMESMHCPLPYEGILSIGRTYVPILRKAFT